MDLLVSYGWGQYRRAKPEILRVLRAFGDPAPAVEKTAVLGIAVANTCLDNREVIARCHRLWAEQPTDSFEFAVKWVPVDYWCDTDLEAMKRLIDKHITPRIGAQQRWAMKVYKRRWQKYHSIDIVEFLAAGIDRPVDLGRPELIVWVDVVGRRTAISLLRPRDVFSIGVPTS